MCIYCSLPILHRNNIIVEVIPDLYLCRRWGVKRWAVSGDHNYWYQFTFFLLCSSKRIKYRGGALSCRIWNFEWAIMRSLCCIEFDCLVYTRFPLPVNLVFFVLSWEYIKCWENWNFQIMSHTVVLTVALFTMIEGSLTSQLQWDRRVKRKLEWFLFSYFTLGRLVNWHFCLYLFVIIFKWYLKKLWY